MMLRPLLDYFHEGVVSEYLPTILFSSIESPQCLSIITIGVVHAYVDQKLLKSNKIKSFN
jgi:hypothetical protein